MIKLSVKKHQLVLEVGSGHNPHPRSDILCDQFLLDDTQRQRKKINIDRPLVVGAGERLPFKKNSFDFVYCSQVLEHSPSPLLFIKELGRVGKAGLIIIPNIVRERLFGWTYHRWYFWQKGSKVCCLKKESNEISQLSQITHTLFQKSLGFRRCISEKEAGLNIYYYWQDKPGLIQVAERFKTERIRAADKKVNEILSRMEFDWKKDLIFWVGWMKERIENKWRKIIRKIAWWVKGFLAI
ncbi:hypothetical protein A2160_02060 [Candidatus Beckwithbacteria bacterium RBG_13_42_9]|uniref:Methyltransferase type 11 domain-containing protein n=1 Tax=Candidatus Beckwithbacteria bacterium RBG_13_42_9 TaxID=1797457 RepID=A0A1F5E7C7_9BACT|nr:MAG: hypothetical protein A2160_02060 [Candidatus Beckwithbacteria bacterium RBG_13_42_9]